MKGLIRRQKARVFPGMESCEFNQAGINWTKSFYEIDVHVHEPYYFLAHTHAAKLFIDAAPKPPPAC